MNHKRKLKKVDLSFVRQTTIGVGLIHKLDKIFFVVNGHEVFDTHIPPGMKDEKLYPLFSMVSRDDKILINLG